MTARRNWSMPTCEWRLGMQRALSVLRIAVAQCYTGPGPYCTWPLCLLCYTLEAYPLWDTLATFFYGNSQLRPGQPMSNRQSTNCRGLDGSWTSWNLHCCQIIIWKYLGFLDMAHFRVFLPQGTDSSFLKMWPSLHFCMKVLSLMVVSVKAVFYAQLHLMPLQLILAARRQIHWILAFACCQGPG